MKGIRRRTRRLTSGGWANLVEAGSRNTFPGEVPMLLPVGVIPPSPRPLRSSRFTRRRHTYVRAPICGTPVVRKDQLEMDAGVVIPQFCLHGRRFLVYPCFCSRQPHHCCATVSRPTAFLSFSSCQCREYITAYLGSLYAVACRSSLYPFWKARSGRPCRCTVSTREVFHERV